jgi:LacI family transcriptional regulator
MTRTDEPGSAVRLRNIALLIEVTSTHARGLIRGISHFAQSQNAWRLHLLEQLRPTDIRHWLDHVPCDGLIARVETQAIARILSDRGLPVVNVGGAAITAQWPRVDTDNAAVCGLAVNHLVERGYRHFGFCGMPQYEWSGWRRGFFAEELARHGLPCESFELPSLTAQRRLGQRERRALTQWISRQPKPLGVMACNDHCGRAVLEACVDAGVSVPDKVGVISVDNDDLICELCFPPLSSIEANRERIGYVAAEMLGHLLHAAEPKPHETLIKPTTLVCRKSTDATAVREPIVAESLRFIRAYASKEIGAEEVARHVNTSRRFLEKQFQTTLSRTIHTEIQRVRLETAQRLLGETDWKLETIAQHSGFRQAAYMSAVFQQKLGLRPGEYRRRVQNRP